MIRICIYGAGAVGSHLAVRLATHPDVTLSVIARGEHLAAIRRNGLTLETDTTSLHAWPDQAVDHPQDLPQQDIVIIGLKATDIAREAIGIGSLLDDGGLAVFLNNGIPWWWQYGQIPHPVCADARANSNAQTLALLDPDATLWSHVRPQRVIGGVVYSQNELEAPGRVRHRGQTHIHLGEPQRSPSGVPSDRLSALLNLFTASGLHTTYADDIRACIWEKLLVNIASNPICTLTRLDNQSRQQAMELVDLGHALQAEIRTVASAMGWQLTPPLEFLPDCSTRFSVKSGQSHRPSMLQDVMRERALEVNALVGQPLQFARKLGIATPVLDVVYALLNGLDRSIRQQSYRYLPIKRQGVASAPSLSYPFAQSQK